MATTPKCHVRILRLLTHEPMNASIYSNAKARTALPPTITIYCFPFTAYRQRSRQSRTAQTRQQGEPVRDRNARGNARAEVRLQRDEKGGAAGVARAAA